MFILSTKQFQPYFDPKQRLVETSLTLAKNTMQLSECQSVLCRMSSEFGEFAMHPNLIYAVVNRAINSR